MFLEQGIKEENTFWKYLLGLVFILFASVLGQLPMLLAIGYETLFKGKVYPSNNEEVMHFFEPNLMLFLLLIPFVFVVITIVLVVRYLHKQTLLSIITSRQKTDWSRVWFSFITWSIFTIFSTLLFWYFSPDDFVFNLKPIPFVILILISAALIPVQTSAEEFVFRGYLMQGFANLFKNRWIPLLMTSIIFGLMHLANPEVTKMGYIILIYYIGTGLLLGIITVMDDGMELALGFHTANNLIGALLVTSDWSALQTYSIFKDISEPSTGIDVIVPVVIVYPLLLILLGKKYKWRHWKEKLTGKLE